jgi:hypothetical protein
MVGKTNMKKSANKICRIFSPPPEWTMEKGMALELYLQI